MKNALMNILLAVLSLSLIFACYGCDGGTGDKNDTVDSTTVFLGDTTQEDTSSDLTEDFASAEISETPEEDLEPIDQWREYYNNGTCKSLKGNVSVLLFYVNDFESSWTDEETDRFTKNEVEPALLFLEKEAEKYGVELNLTVEKAYSGIRYDKEVVTSVEKAGFATADVLWYSAVKINYKSSSEMVNALRKEYKTDDIVCLTIFNKGGTSYAVNPKRGSDIRVDEHSIVFVRSLYATQNGPSGSQASTIAHEMLHLFGAEDFYITTSRKRLTTKHYPKDIMLSVKSDVNDNEISSATAFFVGWTDSVPDVIKKKGW